MKKLITIIMSIIAVIAISTSFAMPAMAAINVYSPNGTVIDHTVNNPTLNGKSSNQVKGKSRNGSNNVTFEYTGDGSVDDWEIVDENGNRFPIEDSDGSYRIVERDGNHITIEILDWDAWQSPNGYTVNAIVKNASSSNSANKDTSSKSPSTGAISLVAASFVAAGAGVSALALLKKNDAE